MSNDKFLKEVLTDLLTNHQALEMQFVSKSLEEFWLTTLDMLPRLDGKTLCPLSTCSNMYMWIRFLFVNQDKISESSQSDQWITDSKKFHGLIRSWTRSKSKEFIEFYAHIYNSFYCLHFFFKLKCFALFTFGIVKN